MLVLNGKSVFGGVAFGKIHFYSRTEQQIKRTRVDDIEGEVKRFQDAKTRTVNQLEGLYEKARLEVGETNAMIFQIHQMMLEDLDYCESIINIITSQGVNAEYAVATTSDNFSKMFSVMDDAYMRERASDVRDVSERLVSVLMNASAGTVVSDEPVIIAAEDLVPSETVQLDKNKVLAFVTSKGSVNSHTAILARTMNIPAIIDMGKELKNDYDGCDAIVDGFTGKLYINPTDETIKILAEKKRLDEERKELLLKQRGKENITLDGQKINLYANIGGLSDLGSVLQNDAGGIGLFRSEFLYLESENYPTEDEQFQAYKTVAETMAGKKVIIRTLDIGADKQVDYFELPKEENPALGFRAIRICLTRTEVFRTQLRALFRASAYGKIAIMFPMITSVEEVREIKAFAETIKSELRADGIHFDENIEMGIMIETPAAAVISDLLAKEVDFFSVGTNDLTQYTLAIDRQNPALDKFYKPHHTAILRLLNLITQNAHKNGIWVGICGELGADMELTEAFLSMGIDELSVSPACILPLRKKIRETDVGKIRDSVLEKALN